MARKKSTSTEQKLFEQYEHKDKKRLKSKTRIIKESIRSKLTAWITTIRKRVTWKAAARASSPET